MRRSAYIVSSPTQRRNVPCIDMQYSEKQRNISCIHGIIISSPVKFEVRLSKYRLDAVDRVSPADMIHYFGKLTTAAKTTFWHDAPCLKQPFKINQVFNNGR